MVVIALILLALVVGTSWFFYGKTINAFTADAPASIQMTAPTEADTATGTEKLERLRGAMGSQQSVTVELTAGELNALIARHPSFTDLRGKLRVGIANSVLDVAMSVPLSDLPLPRLKHRWFNGTARFGLIYDEDRFNLAVKSLEANGQSIDLSGLQSFADIFNNSFNEGFNKSQRKNRESDEFWQNVKSMTVVDDKLVITTKGAEAEPTTI